MYKNLSIVAIAAACLMVGAVAQDSNTQLGNSSIKHVLLISIDGMHAVDFKNCMHGVGGAAASAAGLRYPSEKSGDGCIKFL